MATAKGEGGTSGGATRRSSSARTARARPSDAPTPAMALEIKPETLKFPCAQRARRAKAAATPGTKLVGEGAVEGGDAGHARARKGSVGGGERLAGQGDPSWPPPARWSSRAVGECASLSPGEPPSGGALPHCAYGDGLRGSGAIFV